MAQAEKMLETSKKRCNLNLKIEKFFPPMTPSPTPMPNQRLKSSTHRNFFRLNIKITLNLNFRLSQVDVGANVLIPVPSVDRAKTDFRNVIGLVMDENAGFYRIGTSDGILPTKYVRSQFLPCPTQFLKPEDVPNRTTTLRSAATAESNTTGQGHVHCACAKGCTTKQCKCRQLFRVCNSRCHNSMPCKNK